MLRFLNRYTFLALTAGFLAVACEDDDTITTTTEDPATYNFQNVDRSGQLQRIQMLDTLIRKVREANDGETKVTAAELTALYENSAKMFGTDKNLASKTYDKDGGATKNAIYALFNQVEALSGNPANVEGGYLVTPEGLEPAQLLAKGLMGSVLYWQATDVYLGQEKMNADNSKVTEGQGTAMQHHWDEAFGYFGVPTDFPANEGKDNTKSAEERAWFWGSYSNQRADQLDLRQDIMKAFIKGRAAIGRNDMIARDEAIATIREKWDLLVAANVVHYLNSAMKANNEQRTGAYYHNWSEGLAFAYALQYNPERAITNEEFAHLIHLFGANPKEATEENLQEANLLLKEVYGFTDAQLLNL
ncbi:hypothetical protein D770_13685 [Flammeovirgaceae bacterium 311]|nr:hypothetical protein D770_13685 [Flammeovirgaceae bacterium 311]